MWKRNNKGITFIQYATVSALVIFFTWQEILISLNQPIILFVSTCFQTKDMITPYLMPRINFTCGKISQSKFNQNWCYIHVLDDLLVTRLILWLPYENLYISPYFSNCSDSMDNKNIKQLQQKVIIWWDIWIFYRKDWQLDKIFFSKKR